MPVIAAIAIPVVAQCVLLWALMTRLRRITRAAIALEGVAAVLEARLPSTELDLFTGDLPS